MPEPNAVVLSLAGDLSLLETLTLLLESVGYIVLSNLYHDLGRRLSGEREYALAVLCHSTSREEKVYLEMRLHEHHKQTPVYSLVGTVHPKDFLEHVTKLCGTKR